MYAQFASFDSEVTQDIRYNDVKLYHVGGQFTLTYPWDEHRQTAGAEYPMWYELFGITCRWPKEFYNYQDYGDYPLHPCNLNWIAKIFVAYLDPWAALTSRLNPYSLSL